MGTAMSSQAGPTAARNAVLIECTVTGCFRSARSTRVVTLLDPTSAPNPSRGVRRHGARQHRYRRRLRRFRRPVLCPESMASIKSNRL